MDKAVNILSLVPYKFLPPDMGGQKGIAFFNRYLSRLVNLSCVTIKENSAKDSEPYPIINNIENGPFRYINLCYFFTLRRIIREQKITHLIIEHPYYGWLGILLKWFCKVKLIVHSHNIESLRFKTMNKWWWGILWYYEKMTHRKADHNFFIHDEDRNFGIEKFRLVPEKCTTITYGFELTKAPSPADKQSAREQICKLYQVDASDKILLFNGTLGYKPNLDALEVILNKINALLLADPDFKYKIIVCGNKLPENYNGLRDYKERNIIYAGFVDDINLYFKGADIFINPVTDGGGIKTKVVEALGYNLSVISTKSGAIGIPQSVTGNKMKLTADHDWVTFSTLIKTTDPAERIPASYFLHFYWGNIAEKAKNVIT